MLYSSETLTTDEITKLKTQYGAELTAVHARKGILVFRKPTRTEYDLWADKARTGGAGSAECRQLAQSCLAGVTYEDLMVVVDDQPALLQNEITSAITGMAGLKDQIEVKKL